jgi:hypothetical protein
MDKNKEWDDQLQSFLGFQNKIIQEEQDSMQIINNLIENLLKTP